MPTKNAVTPDFHSRYFDSIQVLRALAALLVVAEHIRFLACGAFGVDIFFCISGFMIMYTTHKDISCFFRKRLLRILPFYWIMTFAAFFLLLLFPQMFESTQASTVSLAKSLFFIPFDVGNGVLQPLFRIGWTLNCEVFFYLLFGLCCRISHRFRGLLCSIFLLGLTVVGQLISARLLLSSVPFWYQNPFLQAIVTSAPFRFFTDSIMLEFALGIWVYYLARWVYNALYCSSRVPSPKVIRRLSATGLLIGSMLLTVLALTSRQVNILGGRRFLIWGLPAFLITLCFFLAGLALPMPAKLVKLGNMSFSLYLIHYYPVMFLDRYIFDFSTLRPLSLLGAVCAYAVVLLCAYIAWQLIEVRLTKLLRRRLYRL